MNDKSHVKSEESVYLTHPLAVALRQIVVYRTDVNAFARQRIQVCGKRCHKRFAFARFHLRYSALVEHDAADQLAVEVSHAEHSAGRFANSGKCFGKNVVKRFSVRKSFLEYIRFTAKFFVGKRLEFRLQRVYLRNCRIDLFQFTRTVRAENRFKKSHYLTSHKRCFFILENGYKIPS